MKISVLCAEWRRGTKGARNDSCSFFAGQNVCRANTFLEICRHVVRTMFVSCDDAEPFSKSGLN